MKRREFLKIGSAGTLAFVSVPTLAAEEKSQKFKIGMAATTWLTATPTTAAYWNAADGLSSLDIGATEADNSEARLDTVYGEKVDEFVSRSHKVGGYLTG